MTDKVLLHTVHITFSTVSEEKAREILARFQQLAKDCGGTDAGILGWIVARNISLSKTKRVDLLQVALFRDDEAFQAFRKHPVHQALRTELSGFADWIPADVEASRAALKQMLEAL